MLLCSLEHFLHAHIMVSSCRDTPTSAGPNSFGKTKQGFCDAKKVFEKSLKKKMEDVKQ